MRKSSAATTIVSLITVLHIVFNASGQVPGSAPRADPFADSLRNHVTTLASESFGGRFGPGAEKARQYIIKQYRAAGLEPLGDDWLHSFALSGMKGKNVVGVRRAKAAGADGHHVIVSAHYDHLGKQRGRLYPGAADNASGVACLLEAARRSADWQTRRDLVFVAFDLEERGLLGSFAWVARPPLPIDKCDHFITMDILGRKALGFVDNMLFAQGWEWTPRILEPLSRAAKAESTGFEYFWTDLTGDRSDFVAFKRARVPHLFFSTGENRDYHRPTDTVDRIDFPLLGRQARAIERVVRHLAGTDEPYRSRKEPVKHLIEFESMKRLAKALLKSGDPRIDKSLELQLRGLILAAGRVVKRGEVRVNDRKMLLEVARRLQGRLR